MSQSFCIKSSYKARKAPQYYRESPADNKIDGGKELKVYQPEVYEVAKRAARKLGCSKIIDLGCGSAAKLAKLHPEFSVIGVDFGPNIKDCRANYDFGEWIEANFESGVGLDLPPSVLTDAVVICSDVIEHLVDPTPLLKGIIAMLKTCPLALISTPERSLKNGWFDKGPPSNPHHVREWTLNELCALVDELGASRVYSGLTTTHSLSEARNTILLACGGANLKDVRLNAEMPPGLSKLTYTARVLRKTFGVVRKGE